MLEYNPNNFNFFKKRSVEKKIRDIKQDLKKISVVFDVFSYETKIIKNKKKGDEILKKLNKFIYSNNGAKFIKTSNFLDDKDRVIVNRGFDLLIDIMGADHHGYINRMKSVLMMGGYSQNIL